jgi:hypothetical protein
MSDDHKKGKSKPPEGSFAKAAEKALDNYEAWRKENGNPLEPGDVLGVDFHVKYGNSLSEYIAILRTND